MNESFKPIPVMPPSHNPALFRLRCWVDLQLGSIAKALRPAMADLHGDVLDVGAGQSPWREWLPQGCAYYGIDVQSAADYGMSRQADVVYYDGRTIPYPAARFDGAICIEVLEHVEEPAALLAEIARVLKPRSPLLLTMPWSARRHHVPHDYQRFTREKLMLVLQQAGFEQVEVRERGNDLSAIASKLVALAVRLAKPQGLATVWCLPLVILVAPLTVVMLIASHVSVAAGLGADEDPLGYFARALRADIQAAVSPESNA
jgi:SAM-dependent methyltransferase